MIKNANQFLHRLSAFLLAVLVVAGALLSNSMPVHAADGTINYHAGDDKDSLAEKSEFILSSFKKLMCANNLSAKEKFIHACCTADVY